MFPEDFGNIQSGREQGAGEPNSRRPSSQEPIGSAPGSQAPESQVTGHQASGSQTPESQETENQALGDQTTDGDIPHGQTFLSLTLHSDILGQDMKYSAYLPAGFKDNGKYPILYLLHGAFGDETDFFLKGNLAQTADAMIASGQAPEVIIVTPDACGNSYYINDFEQPGLRYEDYFTKEFFPGIENDTPFSGTRFIGGLSMGGWGSLYYGFILHDMFKLVYAMSPAAFGKYGDIGAIAANYAGMKLPEIVIECGTEDNIVGWHSPALHRRLSTLGIPHEYISRPGAHDWPFWQGCFPSLLSRLKKFC